jgi:VRR-NUC domain
MPSFRPKPPPRPVSEAEQKRKNQATMDMYAALSGKPTVSLMPVAPKRERKPTAEREHPTEHQEQVKVIHWWRHACKVYGVPEYALFAVPNGGSRGVVEAVGLKAEGVRPGVPDLFLAVPRGGLSGMFVEMKAIKGRASPEQTDFIASARLRGYRAEFCFGADAAIEAITNYMGRA